MILEKDPKLRNVLPAPSKNSGFNNAITGPKNMGDINKNKINERDHVKVILFFDKTISVNYWWS